MRPRSRWLVKLSGETTILAIEELLIDKEGRENKKEELAETIGERPFL